jgi:translation initiation factor 4E
MTTASMLTGPALQASRAALSAAMEDQSVSSSAPEDLEPGEIQEIDMETQADSIRTVFSDPTNFNVKVCVYCRVLKFSVLSTF